MADNNSAPRTNKQAQQAKFASSSKELKNPRKMHMAYAEWQEHVGNTNDARNSYEFILSKDPKSADAQLGLARLDLLAGRKQLAEQRFLATLKTNPTNPLVMDAVGQFYASQKRYDEAVEMISRSVQADPNNSTTRFHLAIALAKSGDIAAATPHFIRIVGEAEAHYNLGVILYGQGNISASEHQFEQALAQRPELEQARTWLSDIQREKQAQWPAATASTGQQQRAAPNSNQQATRYVLQQTVRPQIRSGQSSYGRSSVPEIRPVSRSQEVTGQFQGSIQGQGGFRQGLPSHSRPSLPSPSNISADQIESMRRSMTPQQFEQWQNQLR